MGLEFRVHGLRVHMGIRQSWWWPASGEATMKPTDIRRSVKRSSIKRSWPAGLFLAGMVQFAGTAPAHAGLFDFLFGAPRPPQPVYAPQPSGPLGQPHKVRREPRQKPVSAASDGPSSNIARDLQEIRRLATVAREQGVTAAFLQDPTLKSGDIVVTPNGIAVYEAASKKSNPFRPLAQSRLAHRSDLAQLQRAFTLRQISPVAVAEGDPMSPLVIHARGNRAAEFQANTDPAEEKSVVIEKLGAPRSGRTATTIGPPAR